MTKLKNFVPLFLFTLFVLSILRIILFYAYPSDFTPLTKLETFYSFLMGIRVDFITTCMIFALPTLLLFLPFPFIRWKSIQVIIYSLLFISISALILICSSDLIYFEHVHRHVANEMNIMGNDTHMFLDMAKSYLGKITLFIIFEFILFYIFKKSINFNIQSNFNLKGILLFLAMIIFIIVGIRNKIIDKPFSISNAFTTNKTASGNLALNGFFSMVKSIKEHKTPHFMSKQQARDIVHNTLTSKEFLFINPQYPLLRKLDVPAKLNKKPNIVIILLESWSAKYIDSFSNNHLGVTPNFDKLASEGLKFPNFFANGQRSIEGITALFTGVPVLPYYNFLGHGLELSNFSYLGNNAKNAGYSTLAMQSSKRSSFRVDSIAKIAGFEQYYGAEDIPDLGAEQKSKKPTFGTWDNNMFSFYLKKINQLKEPFLTFTFTSSTHSTFVSPGKKWEKYPHSENSILGYLNTLNYADDAIGKFMENARKQKWFDNTIFIFMADHALGLSADQADLDKAHIHLAKNRVLERMRIPLVIYAPKIFTPKVIEQLGSQADILPTLTHLLGWKTPIATASNSLFSQKDKPFVLFSNGDLLGFIEGKGYIKHNLTKALENTLNKKATKIPLAFYQLIDNAEHNNRIYPLNINKDK